MLARIVIALLLSAPAFGQTTVQFSSPLVTVDTPAITITTGTADTTATSTASAREAHVFIKFGTVAGTFTTCTIQAKTTYDGTNYLTFGSAVAVAATTGTGTAWTLIGQLGTTGVTTSAASTTVALGFGRLTKFTFACSGAYGTSAPATVSVIYR